MFENELIKLRKLSPGDCGIYHTWRNDPAVMCSTSPALDLYTAEETEKYISAIAAQPNAKGYMIEHKESGRTVGIVSLIRIDSKNRCAELIIDIGEKDMWGKGIGTAAVTLILQFAFDELNLHRVFLQVFAFNEHAIKLYEKMGFTHEGRLRHALYRTGNWHDIVVMGILKPEYKDRQG